jgi:3-methyladenine DNA glycosylase AlkC
MASEPQPFKNLVDGKLVRRLAGELAAVPGHFEHDSFVRRANRGLARLELKDRVRQVAHALRHSLDSDYERAAEHIVRSLPEARQDTEEVSSGFGYWPYCQYVEDFGGEHFEVSMAAMHALTQRFSAEFAIRPFLDREPERTLAVLAEWVEDPSPHVRRLCSEGTRPRLPWGMRLNRFIEDPRATRPILEGLVDDDELYVRRSVANHVNDIAKDHPGEVVALCEDWSARDTPERQWIVRHALRTLVKRGDPAALAVLGYGNAEIEVTAFEVDPSELRSGDSTVILLELRSTATTAQRLLVDYAVHFTKADGTQKPKVFKWKELELGAGERIEIRKKHSFREVTTRRHYPGAQRFELQVNGNTSASAELTLVV